jgi:hypothetical protein
MNLLSRVERLEREISGTRGPDHMICYVVDIGEDDDARQAEALAAYKAEHDIGPRDTFGFICQKIVAAEDGRP